MKFFVDTADIKEIKDLAATGMVDGVTTNPTIFAGALSKGEGYGDQVAQLIRASEIAMAEAWSNEQMSEVHKMQQAVRRPDVIQVGPSWISR